MSEPTEKITEKITATLLGAVDGIARDCQASAIFVYMDALDGEKLPIPPSDGPNLLFVTKTAAEVTQVQEQGLQHLAVPNVPLTRDSQVKIAVFLALTHGKIQRGETIVFLSGHAGRAALDTLFIAQVGLEAEMFATFDSDVPLPIGVQPEVVERVVHIAVQIGNEGREGKSVGGLFVVGDSERVGSLSRQLILNPFRGYDEAERNILDDHLRETVKELSTIDGAFIIRGDGVLDTCGAYLKTAPASDAELPRGLGARHHAAAGITAVTESIAVCVSESTGNVTLFRGGQMLAVLERSARGSAA